MSRTAIPPDPARRLWLTAATGGAGTFMYFPNPHEG